MNITHLLASVDLNLAHMDPSIIRMALAAIVFGLAVGTARNFLGKLAGLALGVALAWMFFTHNLQYLYPVLGVGAIVSFVLRGTRRARV